MLKKLSLILGGILLAAAAAHAQAPYDLDIVYYTDSTYTVVAGKAYFSCSGRTTLKWGYATPYYEETELEACGRGPYDISP
jgi:hypothetical protein